MVDRRIFAIDVECEPFTLLFGTLGLLLALYELVDEVEGDGCFLAVDALLDGTMLTRCDGAESIVAAQLVTPDAVVDDYPTIDAA